MLVYKHLLNRFFSLSLPMPPHVLTDFALDYRNHYIPIRTRDLRLNVTSEEMPGERNTSGEFALLLPLYFKLRTISRKM